ncbi:T9SS type A sorting domain-containing protein [Neolewinella persica]|uniref:T9SS type A sorting domain-containing protein n=1 Tax=Neolewinella persica TaxID=70998 RepID=UPI00036B2204|nr:T9SS type A sorting domain-containing protein [Neolewinella persica]
MRNKITLLAALLFVALSSLQAQNNRFIDPIYGVSAPTVDTFGQNFDFLFFLEFQAGARPSPVRQLEMDVYEPIGDEDLSLRPVVVVYHTGNFLNQYQNRGLYGTRKDSAAVQITKELTRRGFVGISADYRLGWNAPSPDVNVRTKTILEAAYRGGQDAHTMARYLRKSVAEDGNPYRIDTSRIVFWGLGTGGYVTLTHAYLDDVQEVLDDVRFYDEMDNPFVDINVNADPQGLMPTSAGPLPLNIPNHVGYSSDVAMSVNGNGALGDIDWIEGKDHEPIMLGFHNPGDIFAPFSFGDVVVPTTMDIVIPCVGGTEQVIEKSNEFGNQDTIMEANATDLPNFFGPLAEAINVKNAAYQQVVITPPSDQLPACEDQTVETSYELSHDNMYPFVGQGIGTPYNWVDPVAARAEIEAFIAAGNVIEGGADVVLGGEQATNPNAFNAAGAKLVIDTMINFFLPRAYVGMNLEMVVSTNDLLTNQQIGLEVFPNPANEGFTVRTAEGHAIRSLRVMDMNGRIVTNLTGINATTRFVNRGNLPRGAYILQIQLDEGTTARKLILD